MKHLPFDILLFVVITNQLIDIGFKVAGSECRMLVYVTWLWNGTLLLVAFLQDECPLAVVLFTSTKYPASESKVVVLVPKPA